MPYVTKHKYKVHWEYGLDFTSMELDITTRWQKSDSDLYLIFNFTDERGRVDVITGNLTVPNATLLHKPEYLWQTGDNLVLNDTIKR